MRHNIISFIFSSEKRKDIVKVIFDYPKRQWSCSSLEDLTKIPHATVFRTINGLKDFGLLKSIKINRKDIMYELVEDNPLSKEINRILNIEKIVTKDIAHDFIKKIKSYKILCAVLYGSSVKGNLKPESDIDILIVIDKHNKELENKIHNVSAMHSSKLNRTIAVSIMDLGEITKEKNSQFIKSVKANIEVIYGKSPF